jgi:large subunit ribosomal protein L4
MRAALDKLETGIRKVLLVDNDENRNLELGSRNLEGVTLVPSRAVTTYDLLGHQHVLLSEAAAKKLSEALK